MENLEQKSLFEKLKKHIELSLYKQLAEHTEKKISGKYDDNLSISPNRNDISDIGERIRYIDETTIQYLMKLTNDYIRVKIEKDSSAIDADIALFAKFGFDVTVLDSMINQMSNPHYNLNHEMGPSKLQEQILQTVFTHFGCPGKLPTIEDIYNIVSKFGIEYVEDGKLPIIDSRHFDDPYNTDNTFYTAIQNGLSVEQIINSKLQLDQIMNLYNAPRNPSVFSRQPDEITRIVYFTNSDLEQMSTRRAVDLYQVLNYRLSRGFSITNNQLSQEENQETIRPVHR